MEDKRETQENITNSQTFEFAVPVVNGTEGENISGEVVIVGDGEGNVRVKNGFRDRDVFLVAMADWANADNRESHGDSLRWLREQPEEEPEEEGEEQSIFPLEITSGFVIDEGEEDESYIFQDGERKNLTYDEVVEIMMKVKEYFKDNKESTD